MHAMADTPSTDSIDLSIGGGIAVVTINRPEVRNSIDLATAKRLTEVVAEIEETASVRVGILTGAGGVAFSAGADLRARSRGEARANFPPYGFAGFVRRPRNKPFIAAVNGYAVGGGLEMAMACELVVASPNATFSLPEPLRGVIAGGDCLPLALSRLPLSVAWDLALTSTTTRGTNHRRSANGHQRHHQAPAPSAAQGQSEL
jgi:enoyl-CoA hydratase